MYDPGLLRLAEQENCLTNVADVAADYPGRPHRGAKARLYKNNGTGTFSDVSQTMGVNKVLHAMGSSFGDFDNDGWLDFSLGTGDPEFTSLFPNRAFRNQQGSRFQDVTTSSGLGHLQKGHAISFADLDINGSQDRYAMLGGAFTGDTYWNSLFVNPGNSNHWVTLKLEGVTSKRSTLGACIRVQVKTAAGSRSIYKSVATGGGFGSTPLRQEIGLGDATAIEAVEIFWPVTGKTRSSKAWP